jgi:hypothetical protein
MKITHKCKVQCYSLDKDKAESLGIEDKGKWLPFMFDVGAVELLKQTTDEPDSEVYNCTTIFLRNGSTFIIDTPYNEFSKIFEDYYESYYGPMHGLDTPSEDDENFEL